MGLRGCQQHLPPQKTLVLSVALFTSKISLCGLKVFMCCFLRAVFPQQMWSLQLCPSIDGAEW